MRVPDAYRAGMGGGGYATVIAVVLVGALVPISVADVRSRIVPDPIVVPAIALAILAGMLMDGGLGWGAPVGALAGAGVLLLPALLRPDAMGMGDVKLAGLIGACLGVTAGIAAIVVGLGTGACFGLVLARRGRARPRDVFIPLAPFLAVGALLVLSVTVV
ncbi:MAG: prepilin peptidase [Thermoleophilia bacterium]|nr:prepilin peptidase [Thermoleophilia bacterium]